jgi:hypothetical protein
MKSVKKTAVKNINKASFEALKNEKDWEKNLDNEKF